MELELSSSPSLSFWDFIVLLLVRPVLAIGFVLSLIVLGWLLAWKLVLVHVPLVQEIFGLRKKAVKSKPPTRRLSKFYSSIDAQNSASGCYFNSIPQQGGFCEDELSGCIFWC